MATNRYFGRCAILIIICFCILSPRAYCGESLSPEQLKVQKIYLSLIGIKELTGHNDGPEVEMILHSCGLKKGDAWCAAYVCYCFKTAGVKAPISGYSPNWFQSKYVIWTKGGMNNKTPRACDVGGIYFPKMGRIAHTVFVHKWEPGTGFMISAEGNANNRLSREGNCCCMNRRLKTNFSKISRYI